MSPENKDTVALQAMQGCYPLALLDGLAAEYIRWYGIDPAQAYKAIRADAMQRIRRIKVENALVP